MPTLNWIGKDAVVRHHEQVPFHLLEEVPALSCGEDSGNLIVEGDNLLALKALLPHYAGQVKCIYIDPPYNTGQDERGNDGKRTGWIYSDNVDSPEMREWLGKVVGVEAEDLCRHDKWLCMMYPRRAKARCVFPADIQRPLLSGFRVQARRWPHPGRRVQGFRSLDTARRGRKACHR